MPGSGGIALGIGGSATTDGGAGAAPGAGIRLVGRTTSGGGGPRRTRPAAVREVRLRRSPATSPTRCRAPMGPPRSTGRRRARRRRRSRRWTRVSHRYADALELATGRRERDTPGAGAAGGLGFGLLALAGAFPSLRLEPGIDLVMAEAGFDAALATADLVITGEGRIDRQTAFGKTAMGVARRALGGRCPVRGGGWRRHARGSEALAAVGAVAVPVSEGPGTVEAAMAAGAGPLERCGERIARLVGIAG